MAMQLEHEAQLNRLFEIFKGSQAELRPHFILTGPSGSGKSYIINELAQKHELSFLEINAAQLTKEGTSGNSLSKALSPLRESQHNLTVCFVDEFDKLFISGNSNSELAHEMTNGVQNEFLKVLENDLTSVFGDYGKYVNISVKNVLFVFAGAFNGEEDIDLDRLREIGVKTEFLGRVGLTFTTEKVTLERMIETMQESKLLADYLRLFPKEDPQEVKSILEDQIRSAYELNTLGYRLISTLIHQYFIKGKDAAKKEVKQVVFNTTLELD